MTLNEILTNEELRRHEFPVARDKIFLAHAGVCPLPRRVADAIAECARQGTLGDQEAFMLHRLDEARKLAAQLLNCQTDEIALVGPTSLGLSFVAVRPEFPQGRQHPHLSRRLSVQCLSVDGAGGTRASQVRLLNTRGLGVIRPMDVMGQVDENTRLVALASCHFISGFRIEHCRHRKISARTRHFILPRRHPDARRVSDDGGACGFSRRRRAQMAARPVRRGNFLRPARTSGKIEPADLRLAQCPLPEFRRAGKNRIPQRRGEIRGRHAESARPRRLDCGDGTGAGNRRGKHRRRTAPQTRAGSCPRCRRKVSRS